MKKNIQKMSHIWSLVCSNFVIDRETNNLSLFNIVEKISLKINNKKVEDGVVVPFNQEIITQLKKVKTGAETSFNMRICYLSPNNKEEVVVEREVSVPEQYNSARIINRIKEIKVFESGEYYFLIKIGDGKEFDEIGRIPLDVEISR